MHSGSRVVITNKEYQGETGTIYRYNKDELAVEVIPDYLEEYGIIKCKCCDIIEIDDITDIGEIEYEVGMQVYDLPLNMICEILEVIKKEGEDTQYKVKYENGKIDTFPFIEEGTFIVKEKDGYNCKDPIIENKSEFIRNSY